MRPTHSLSSQPRLPVLKQSAQVLPNCEGLTHSPVHTCAWSTSGERVAIAFKSSLHVYNTALEELLQLPHAAASIAWAPGSCTLTYVSKKALQFATLGNNHTSRTHAAQLTAMQTRLGSQAVDHVSFSTHGACLVSGLHQLLLHDPARPTYECPFVTVQNNNAELQQPCFSPDGQRVIFTAKTTSEGNAASRVWKLEQQTGWEAREVVLFQREGSIGPVLSQAVACHPGNRLFALRVQYGGVYVFSYSGKLVQRRCAVYSGKRYQPLELEGNLWLSWSSMGDTLRVRLNKSETVVLAFPDENDKLYRAAECVHAAPLRNVRDRQGLALSLKAKRSACLSALGPCGSCLLASCLCSIAVLVPAGFFFLMFALPILYQTLHKGHAPAPAPAAG